MVSMKTKWTISLSTIVALSLLFLGLCWGFPSAGAMQTPVWSDNFNDGNLDGWTVFEGSFSATTLRMESGTDLWNFASHPSTVTTGEWRFTVCVDAIAGPAVAFMATTTSGVGLACPSTCYLIFLSPHGGWIRLYKLESGSQSILGGYDIDIVLGTVFEVIVTRDSNGQFNVWIDGTHRISAVSTNIESSSYFVVRFHEGGYIDNIRVYDEILTTTGTETETTTDTTTTEDGTFTGWQLPPLPVEAIGIGIGVVAIIILIVGLVLLLRPKKIES